MVFFYVLEGRPPSIPGSVNPKTHFEGIMLGKRPLFLKTDLQHRKIIVHCLNGRQSLRPTSLELLTLLRAVPVGGGLFRCGVQESKKRHLQRQYAAEAEEGYYQRMKGETKTKTKRK